MTEIPIPSLETAELLDRASTYIPSLFVRRLEHLFRKLERVVAR
jgi:hypothetical protein